MRFIWKCQLTWWDLKEEMVCAHKLRNVKGSLVSPAMGLQLTSLIYFTGPMGLGKGSLGWNEQS